jgi:ABC-type multidrug transport system fused ATPase/permease subunit
MKSFIYSAKMQTAAKGLADSVRQPGPVSVWSMVRPLMWPWRWWMLAALFLNVVHGLAITFQNLIPKWLISDVLKPPGFTLHERLVRVLILAAIYLVVSNIGRMLIWHLGYRIFTAVRERMVFTLRGSFFRHVNHLCLRFHGAHPSGELFNYLFGSPLATVMAFYQHTSMQVVGGVFTIISTVVLVGMWDPVLTAVLFVMAFVSVLVMRSSITEVRRLTMQFQMTESDVSGRVADILRGSKAVKLYAMEKQVEQDFERDAYRLWRMSYDRDIRTHMQWMKQECVNYFVYALLITVATWRYATGHVDEGMVAAYLTAFGGLTGPISTVFGAVTMWGGAQASIQRIGTVLKTASTTPDPAGPVTAMPKTGDIRYDNVTFSYEAGAEPVLHEVSLMIPYGQRVALVGPSGAGKTTLAQLALRLYDPQSGRVTIGGADLRYIAGSELRRAFGIVPQDPFIFRAPIRENVRVAKPDATDVELIEACKRANAWEFIQELPNQLDENVGEGGCTLSGGQRQRLAIARALLAQPGFLILDEATSALDTLSEKLIQETLERELKGRTALFIAHRLSTVKNCDRIIVMRDGRIEQDGSYTQLVSQPGLFRELVEGQKLVS